MDVNVRFAVADMRAEPPTVPTAVKEAEADNAADALRSTLAEVEIDDVAAKVCDETELSRGFAVSDDAAENDADDCLVVTEVDVRVALAGKVAVLNRVAEGAAVNVADVDNDTDDVVELGVYLA